ncbi:MAG: FxDxF family PEP-CTERM protein [Pseudomonadota bacterium]
MKKTLLAGLLLASGVANADFSDAYDVSNWTQSLNGGAIFTSAAPYLVTMISSDDGNGPDYTDFTITAVQGGMVSFDWAYLNGDIDGSSLDPFGYLLNGAFEQLTADNDSGAQNGSASFMVAAGDNFGFRIYSTDSVLGSSYATVRNFAAPVPEPETYAMMLAGLALLGVAAKRRAA